MSILKDKVPRFGGAVHFHQSCPIFTVVKRMLSSEEQIQLLNNLFVICWRITVLDNNGEFSFVFF